MSRFQVDVRSVGDLPVNLTRAIRALTGFGLSDSFSVVKYLQGSAPCPFVVGVERAVADEVAERLREAGAEVVVGPSSVAVPMLIRPPAVRRRARWLIGGRTVV